MIYRETSHGTRRGRAGCVVDVGDGRLTDWGIVGLTDWGSVDRTPRLAVFETGLFEVGVPVDLGVSSRPRRNAPLANRARREMPGQGLAGPPVTVLGARSVP